MTNYYSIIGVSEQQFKTQKEAKAYIDSLSGKERDEICNKFVGKYQKGNLVTVSEISCGNYRKTKILRPESPNARTYWYCDWNNYMGNGDVKSVVLTPFEREAFPFMVYDSKWDAEKALLYHLCD